MRSSPLSWKRGNIPPGANGFVTAARHEAMRDLATIGQRSGVQQRPRRDTGRPADGIDTARVRVKHVPLPLAGLGIVGQHTDAAVCRR